MSWKGQKKREGRGYHHGNLREALIEAALDLIAAKGPEGFTFAEAARQAGVSAAAPYRHFRDRDELVQAVALRGFERFGTCLGEAWNEGRPDPMAAFKRVGLAYLAFARDETPLFSAMLESGIDIDDNRALRKASDDAFQIVRQASEMVCSKLDTDHCPPPMMVALHVWSLTHGIASLFARGDGTRRPLPMPAEDLLEAGVLIYLDGLGIKR